MAFVDEGDDLAQPPWRRRVLVALAVLTVVALVVGYVLGPTGIL